MNINLPTDGELVESALELAERGFSTFPLLGLRPDGRCSCGRNRCTAAGKHPAVKWKSQAAVEPKRIERMFRRRSCTGLGLVTGSGLLVLDIDPRNGGVDSLENLIGEFGELPMSTMVLTGTSSSGRGQHVWFKYPRELTVRSRPMPGHAGIDLKGEGGYVVAPPTVHASGVKYEFEVGLERLTNAPSWLLDLAVERRRRLRVAQGASDLPLSAEVKTYLKTGGIPLGSQRIIACRIARALLSRGADIETAATAIYGALLMSYEDPSSPKGSWTFEEVQEIVESIAANPRDDLNLGANR